MSPTIKEDIYGKLYQLFGQSRMVCSLSSVQLYFNSFVYCWRVALLHVRFFCVMILDVARYVSTPLKLDCGMVRQVVKMTSPQHRAPHTLITSHFLSHFLYS